MFLCGLIYGPYLRRLLVILDFARFALIITVIFFFGVSGYSSLINVAQIRTKIFQEKHRRDDCIRSDDTFK